MRRLICFLLVLALVLSMTGTAFASTYRNSPGEGGKPRPTTPDGGNPKNGDIIMRWVIVLIISLLALIVILILGRKFFKK